MQTSSDLLKAAQVQDGVADQLSRSVEGDKSASVGLVDVSPEQAQLIQQGGWVGFVADPGSVDWKVLTQQ